MADVTPQGDNITQDPPDTEPPPSQDTGAQDPPQGEDIHTADGGVDWKAAARKWEREAKALRQRVSDQEKAQMTEHERAIREAEEKAEARVREEYEARMRTAEIAATVVRLASAANYADPSDALTMLAQDLDTEGLVDSFGKVDEAKIKTALGDLLKRKPYLAGRVLVPNGDTGAKGTPPGGSPDLNSLLRQMVGGA